MSKKKLELMVVRLDDGTEIIGRTNLGRESYGGTIEIWSPLRLYTKYLQDGTTALILEPYMPYLRDRYVSIRPEHVVQTEIPVREMEAYYEVSKRYSEVVYISPLPEVLTEATEFMSKHVDEIVQKREEKAREKPESVAGETIPERVIKVGEVAPGSTANN